MRILKSVFLTAGAIAAVLSQSVLAQFPERAVKMVVPYTPGGPADLLGRFVGQKLGQGWQQPVVVENKPGAGLSVGAEFVARSAPDGYTMLIGASSMLVDTGAGGRSPAENLKDFASVSLVGSFPLVLVASNALPMRNVRELIEYAKAHPGELNFGSSGNGSLTHLAGALFVQMTGAQMVHVPYKGINEALIDLSAGRVQLSFAGAPIGLPLVKAGKMRALGVTSAKRTGLASDLPTVAEGGLPGYDVTPWYGVLSPGGTPPAIVTRLHRDIVKVMESAEVREMWKSWGADATYSKAPEEFSALMRAEATKWDRLVKQGGVKLN